MKFYVTIEGIERLKKSLLNLKMLSIIYVPEILDQYGYTYSTIDEYGSFIISNHINDLIKTYAKSKRIRGIIYSNPELNEELLPNLTESLIDLPTITQMVLFDDYNVPKLAHLVNYFDEIVYFPLIKKVRLIECQRIPNIDKIEWKPK